MQLSKFFLVSLSLHTTALGYPFVFHYPADKQLTPMIVDFIEGSHRKSNGDGRAGGKEAQRPQHAPQHSPPQIAEKIIPRTEPVPVLRETSTAIPGSTDTPTGIEIVL